MGGGGSSLFFWRRVTSPGGLMLRVFLAEHFEAGRRLDTRSPRTRSTELAQARVARSLGPHRSSRENHATRRANSVLRRNSFERWSDQNKNKTGRSRDTPLLPRAVANIANGEGHVELN
jgi:hypothetical protein